MSIENATSGNWVVESAYKNGNDIACRARLLATQATIRHLMTATPSRMRCSTMTATARPVTVVQRNGNPIAEKHSPSPPRCQWRTHREPVKGPQLQHRLDCGVYVQRQGLRHPLGSRSHPDNPHDVNAGDIDSNLGNDLSVEDILRTIIGDLNDHVGASNNPHNVTAVQVPQNNSQNALGYNVQNALNKLQNMIRSTRTRPATSTTSSPLRSTWRRLLSFRRRTVQDALETIYERFKARASVKTTTCT